MKLQNDLFDIISREGISAEVSFKIRLNPECFIYKAHFPERPITPGVCVTQIAVELAEEALGSPLTLTGIKNNKFLALMTPDDVEEGSITYTLNIKEQDGGELRLQAVAKSGNTTYAKMSLTCKKHQDH